MNEQLEQFTVGKSVYTKHEDTDLNRVFYTVLKRGLFQKVNYCTKLEYDATKYEKDNPGKLERYWNSYANNNGDI